MAAGGKEFVSLVSPQDEKPTINFFKGPAFFGTYIRDNFTITTWLCFGAVAQGILFLLFGRLALAPAVGLLLFRTLDAYAMSIGWKHNIYMDGVIQKKVAAVFPNELGEYGNKPADSEVTVLLIGTRINHPLGIMAPGVQEFMTKFPKNMKDLDENSDEWGFLGSTSWLNANDRSTNSEMLVICYFKSLEGLHNFAHGKVHREVWDWWNRNFKSYPHISIYHETYHVPKGNWESIYVNSHSTGIHNTIHKYTDALTGSDMWASPIVDASKGPLKTSAGRMGQSKGREHDKYDTDPYQNQ